VFKKSDIYDFISIKIDYHCFSISKLMEITFSLCQGDEELNQILGLQGRNLRNTQSAEVEADQGFVTVQHDLKLLKSMNEAAKHIIAKDGERVVGYALAMTKDFQDEIPVLKSMFDLIDGLHVNGVPLGEGTYIVMGQVCVDYDYRGKGIFQGMYNKYFEAYKSNYQHIITEIAARNTRSLRAHLNVGFNEIHRYIEPGVEEWIVVMY
jgi:GNAT superfamily N-acetyltransferase